MTSDDLFERDGVWYKRVSVEGAQRIQYDIPLHFYYEDEEGVVASSYTPSDRRSKDDDWMSRYWRRSPTLKFCVRVDAPQTGVRM